MILTEYHLHLAAVAYLRLCPGLRWRHIPNGERRDKRTAAKLKAMGVEAGAADFHLTLPGGQTGWVELKALGRQSAAQKAFQAAETGTGARYAIVRSLDDLEWTLRDWGVSVPHVIPSTGRDPAGLPLARSFPPAPCAHPPRAWAGSRPVEGHARVRKGGVA